MENCNTICETTHKSRQNEETYDQSVELLKAELEHHRSLNEFYLQSRCNKLDEMEDIEKECQALRMQLMQSNEENQKLREKEKQMQAMIDDLQAKLATANLDQLKFDQAIEKKMIPILQRYFSEGQIRCILENRKYVRWSIDDYASAISFRSVSPKAYRYFQLKLNYPLPSLSSLRRWALKTFDIREGFLSDVLAVMREKGKTFTSFQKITVITFDEMAVSSEVQFDSKLEKLVGPCGKVQVIMARGLFEKWKQPIYYKFDQQMTKDILMEAVSRLYHAGYEVVATTCDMGNRGVWTELQITSDNHFFEHPVLKNSKIFVFTDIPHLLKLLRNWFIDDGFLLQQCSKPFKAEVMQAIIDIGNSGDLRVAHRLTQRILDARHTLRQAVKPAAQIWSHTVAKAIKWAGDNGLINVPDYKKFSDFVSIVNKWFDVQNSHQKYGAHQGVNGYGVSIDNQEMVLQLMNSYIQNLRVGSRKSLMPFQKGILISNASLRTLYDYLQNKFPQEFQYILTRRLQQDVLENFFAYIRAMGSCKDNPSGYDFRYRLRWYILGKHSHAVFSINRNAEEDVETSCMSSSSITCETPSTSEIPKTTVTSTPLASSPVASTSSVKSSYQASTSQNISEIDHLQDEIILTKELFSNIINISPEELQEESAHNLEENMDDMDYNDDDLFIFNEKSDNTDLCRLYSESTTSDIVQEAGLEYVAGYVAHRYKTKYPNLEKSTTNDDSGNWIQSVSKGYLSHPSDELMIISKIAEKCFNNFHGEYFSKEDYVIQKVINLIKKDNEYLNCIPEEVLQCLVRTRTYIRVREINKKQYLKNDERRKNKKMKKIISSTKK
jgi:hypothetical protein